MLSWIFVLCRCSCWFEQSLFCSFEVARISFKVLQCSCGTRVLITVHFFICSTFSSYDHLNVLQFNFCLWFLGLYHPNDSLGVAKKKKNMTSSKRRIQNADLLFLKVTTNRQSDMLWCECVTNMRWQEMGLCRFLWPWTDWPKWAYVRMFTNR